MSQSFLSGAKHLTRIDEEKLPARLRDFITMCRDLENLKKLHAETMGRLAHDLGPKKIAVNWGGGKLIESDGKTQVKIVETEIEVLA